MPSFCTRRDAQIIADRINKYWAARGVTAGAHAVQTTLEAEGRTGTSYIVVSCLANGGPWTPPAPKLNGDHPDVLP